MKNILLTLIAALTVLTVNAQVQLDNAVLHNNGAVIYVDGMNTVSNGSSINNFGTIHFGGDFRNTNANDTLTNVALTDTIYVGGNFDIANGNYDGSTPYQGALVMNGTTAQAMNTRSTNADAFYNLEINNTSATGVLINGNVICENSIRFTDGLFLTNSTDSLALATGGSILGSPGILSHVNGPFYREGNSAVSDLFYPIGDGIRYRPATLKNVPVGAPLAVIGFEVVNGATGGTPGLGVESIIDTRHWEGNVISGDYQGAQLELSYGAVEGVTDQSQLIVAQSSAVGGAYYNLDQSGTTGVNALGTVISEFNAQEPYYKIAQSGNMRVNVNAFLEGAYNTGSSSMFTNLQAGSGGILLDTIYNNGNAGKPSNPYGIDMLNTYDVSNVGFGGAAAPVDVVLLTIRDGANPAADLDSTYAWLMDDGTIRDFASGRKPYATFSNTGLIPTSNYTIVVHHRNHIPIMYSTGGAPYGLAVNRTVPPAQTFDLTNTGLVYGIGFQTVNMDGNAGLYIGNAEQFYSPLEVNALDLYVVGDKAANNIEADIYDHRDVNLDNEVNATDWQKTKWANDQLYYSTLP